LAYLSHDWNYNLLTAALTFRFSLFFVTLRKAVDTERDPLVKGALMGMATEESRNATVKVFRSLSEIRDIFKAKPYSFIVFSERMETKIKTWMKQVFVRRPILNEAYHPQEQQDPADNNEGGGDNGNRVIIPKRRNRPANNAALQRLHRARATLNEEGDDPLQESLDLASRAARGKHTSPPKRRVSLPRAARRKQTSPTNPSPDSTPKRSKGKLYEKKRSAKTLEFEDDSDSEYFSDDKQGGAHLSDMPEGLVEEMASPKKKARKSQRKSYEGRKRWTDEEKLAVRKGVEELGEGKWAEIKKLYYQTLIHRTSGQIKVRRWYFLRMFSI
jgi:hypothetical protein